jgi:ferrous iron transport protein B
MHLIGLHGKASLPLFLGFGCNVPAVLGSRIIESKKERELTCFLSTLVPCSARTIIVMGLVGAFIGFKYALLLYILSFFIIFLIGKIAQFINKSESPGLIMEIPPIRVPSLNVIIKSTYFKLKDFIIYAIPLIIAGSALLEILNQANLLVSIENFFSPLFSGFLGLPSFTVIPIIFGILRKELGIIMLATFGGSANLSTILLPRQMIVYSIVMLFYFPCVATISALLKELSFTKTVLIILFEIVLAILLGGLSNLILSAFMP